MYIIVKHYVTINAYTVERIIDNEVDAIALVDIYITIIKTQMLNMF